MSENRTEGKSGKGNLWVLGIVVPVVALAFLCVALFVFQGEEQEYLPVQTQAPTEAKPEEQTAPPQVKETLPQIEVHDGDSAQTKDTMAETLPYVQKVDNADQPIYSGPGYEYEYVKMIGKAGSYTIVEESWDSENHLWGKLKSGAGWIDLTDARTYVKSKRPISLRYGRRSDLDDPNKLVCIADTSEYMVVALFTANEDLTDFYMTYMDWGMTGNYPGEVCYYAQQIPAGSELAAAVAFPGDFDSMGISFVDAGGVPRRYEFFISLEDGSLDLIER